MSESSNPPSSRKAAIQSGSLFYLTGKPCKRGHKSVRYTHTSNCRQCMFERVEKDRHEITLNRKVAEGKCCLIDQPDNHDSSPLVIRSLIAKPEMQSSLFAGGDQ